MITLNIQVEDNNNLHLERPKSRPLTRTECETNHLVDIACKMVVVRAGGGVRLCYPPQRTRSCMYKGLLFLWNKKAKKNEEEKKNAPSLLPNLSTSFPPWASSETIERRNETTPCFSLSLSVSWELTLTKRCQPSTRTTTSSTWTQAEKKTLPSVNPIVCLILFVRDKTIFRLAKQEQQRLRNDKKKKPSVDVNYVYTCYHDRPVLEVMRYRFERW